VKLTDRERLLIARRAAGEYSINFEIRQIVSGHQKNKNATDTPFLEFARLTQKSSWDDDDYERLGKVVLQEIPYPHGIPWWERPGHPAGTRETTKVPARERKRRAITCRICSKTGHNARTCPDKPKGDSPTVDCADGLTRLAPGFDPNPPPEVEEGQEET